MEKTIVIGGSIAGKFAAKALSRIFRQVMILEAGQEWTEKTPRRRVAQGFHPHVLLKGGQEAIEKLFPRLFDQLIEDGSIANNFTKDLKWHHFSSWKPRFLGELDIVQQSRPLMEWHLQKRIDVISTISTRYETSVEQLLTEPGSQKITGVRIRALRTGKEEELYADLVVDASRYGSKSIKWLLEMGVEVKKEKVKIGLFYATRFFSLSEAEPLAWCNLLISPSFPENPYGAYIQSIEGNRFFVTFSGYANEREPKTTKEFLAYAQKLPVPDVTSFLERTEPISEIYIYIYIRFPIRSGDALILQLFQKV